MELREEYKKELSELKEKMIEAQRFAEKFPDFSENILSNKFTKEFTGRMADRYKGLYYPWGINRWFYRKKENICNFKGDFEPKYLWNIYINQLSIFGDNYTDTGIYEITKTVDVFYFDIRNTTFYATDDEIIPLLNSLADWYKEAQQVNIDFKKEKKKKKLLEELKQLEEKEPKQ
jgi:hypothetical protein